MKLSKKLASTTKIRFQDCDPFNHLNNASYFNYLINAREDQVMAAYDLDIYKHGRKTGKNWLISNHKISYLKPARQMETVVIESQLIHFGEKHLQVEMRMLNEDKSEIKAVLWSSLVYFDIRKSTVTDHESDLMELFQDVMLPINERSFDERVNILKS